MLAKFDTDPSFQKLAETFISKIYLDNTYVDHKEHSFPERSDSEKLLLNEMEKLRDRPILIPIFRLGREEILEKLSEALSEPIATGSQRLAVRKACGIEGGTFMDESNLTRIRTCPRQPKSVFAALKRMSPSTMVLDLSIRGEYQELRFGEIVPTSVPMQLTTAEELMKLSREMAPIPTSTCATSVDIQKNVEAGPAELGEKETLTPPPTGLRFSGVSLQPADLSVFQLPSGINLLDFYPDTDPRKFRLDPPPGPKPVKVKFYDPDGK
ncbi:hypothetical protein OESDEN_17247 [Oesophagostomum dentatum]|uniref:Uncharacterized protein n=1 Tax=Oesophagostomum dentatum TaxID=61180 RepID=A0A0B1SHS0_OESDE|nr:hypothetical protein OESDEN_17247 [Oesophagostomum dentatum]